MRVHWLQHADFEDLGCIAPWLAARGDTVTHTRLQAGVSLPAADDFDWLIVLGGPMNIYEYGQHPWLRAEKALIRAAITAGKRVFGICLGAQLIADVLGGKVTRNRASEIGWFPVRLTAAGRASPLLRDWPNEIEVFHWHGDTYALPPGAECLAQSEACEQQAFAWGGGRVVGLQFHPEITAANARDWLAQETLEPAAYVQAPQQILRELPRYGVANRLLLQLLERYSVAA